MENKYLNPDGLKTVLENLKTVFSLSGHTHTKSQVGLGNVDNTADANKSVKSSTKLETYKQDSTTATYGGNYTVYAQWRDASHVRMKCDNYIVETDYATSSASATNASKVNNHTVESDVPANAKFTDTTYTNKAAASGGTDVSLVTTGEKAVWNAKTSNTGTLTGIKMNGASKGTSGVVDLGTVLTGGSQTSTSSADGGSNVYTFSDGSTITVKNGSKGSAGVTPTVKVASGTKIAAVGTPSVTAATSGTTTTFTFNYLKGQKGDKGDPGVNATTTAVATASVNGLMSASDKSKLDGITTKLIVASTEPTANTNDIWYQEY